MLKQTLGRWLHALYARSPISWETRLAIKDRLFTWLAPLLRHTNTYQRWLEHRTDPVEAGQRNDAEVRESELRIDARWSQDNDTLVEYVAGAMRQPFPQPTHVAITTQAPPSALAAKAIAFYLPQFHPIPENDAWWGRGFTEWTNVSKAVPQFVGHDQPRLPGELGFYDLRVPEVMRRQVELARTYGVHGFCFHYYWFAGRRLLERPLDQFLASDIEFPFCVCWANENWTRRWDGAEHDILLGQVHNDENDEAFIRDLLPLLRDRRYIRLGERPLIVVYRPSLLPQCARTLEHWRDVCRKEGIGEVFLAMAQFDVDDPREYGFDAAIEFPPHKVARGLHPINWKLKVVNPEYAGHVVEYADVVEQACHWPEADYPLIRGVFPSWDNEARKPGRGYVFANSTPALYGRWLEDAIAHANEHPVEGDAVVFINAWNEWGEGAYLEPDRRHGYAYLQATRDALEQGMAREDGVVVVSHDAHPHGAQYLALHLARELKAMRVPVELIVLGEGPLLDDYRDTAPTAVLAGADDATFAAAARALRRRGVRAALVNTLASGHFARFLREEGIDVVAMVHELPGVIEEFGLQSNARALAEYAGRIVFAAPAVEAGFAQFAQLQGGQSAIRPQGLYKRNARRDPTERARARQELRASLGLPADCRIVLCVGYADKRKGVDLFLDAAAKIGKRDPKACFVWIGHVDRTLESDIHARIKRYGLTGRVHFPGRRTDTDTCYAGADVYALTSREDPYPSVVLEAFDAALPVVGFAGCGGLDALVRDHGALVPMEDVDAMADAVCALLGDDKRRETLGLRARDLVAADYAFRSYVLDLLGWTSLRKPKVSVVVPNYNYARFLPERMASITGQTLPVYEILVLDDASTDDSLAVLARLQAASPVPVRVVEGARNSGSVFRQWQRGVELARGDYVWIAEADDLSEQDFLEQVLPPLIAGEAVMAYAQSRQMDADGGVLANDYLDYVSEFGADRWRAPFLATLGEELERGLAVKNTIPNVSAAVFRRDVLRDVLTEDLDAICDYRIAGDWLAYLRVLERGKLAFIPASLNLHRRHAQGVTLGGDLRPHLDEVMRMQDYVRTHHPISEIARAQARAYAERLHRQFGLDGQPQDIWTKESK
ncbi:Glycosyl transferase [Lysobacter dokdonensis DS-58]|uniref:Glycosyl transferase n=1 Tax=Lysobacter dokdonensis DS-58 TaxID=1300345 RepID=A0A0A2WPW9_9GAMM|nr:glycoside hydrolase family 99-like domain-containing protein [Lysobacter dokdonensis]KGQ20802.1 Glycosyl transferase [Lysobacter dokdonensis DS-58]